MLLLIIDLLAAADGCHATHPLYDVATRRLFGEATLLLLCRLALVEYVVLVDLKEVWVVSLDMVDLPL